MSIVADYGSDSENSESDDTEQQIPKSTGSATSKPSSFASLLPQPKITLTSTSSVITDTTKTSSSSFASLLPSPKSGIGSAAPHSTKPASTKTKRDGPVRILVDLPKTSVD